MGGGFDGLLDHRRAGLGAAQQHAGGDEAAKRVVGRGQRGAGGARRHGAVVLGQQRGLGGGEHAAVQVIGIGTLGIPGVGAQRLEAGAGLEHQAGDAGGAAVQFDARHLVRLAGARGFGAGQLELARLDAVVALQIRLGEALDVADGVDLPVGHLGAAAAAGQNHY